jgi:hypothetical protein
MTFETCGIIQTNDTCIEPMCKWHSVGQTKPVDPTQDGHCVSEIAITAANTAGTDSATAGTTTAPVTDECNNIRDVQSC